MVVIEQEENENEAVIDNNHSTSPLPSKTTDSTSAATATSNRDVSDGFETASETGVSDNEEDADKNGAKQDQQKEKEQQMKVGDSYEDAFNEEQIKEKALAQANDAKLEGNKLFGEGSYDDALLQYELALEVSKDMPESVELRSVCHANRAACFLKSKNYKDTIKECSKALELNPTYSKALLRREEAHEKLENYEEALSDLKKIVELDPSNIQAKRSIRRLEPLAAEKRERMKEEMMGKLKDLGNSVLGRFGMSMDNFNAVKDPNTGSYSISFNR